MKFNRIHREYIERINVYDKFPANPTTKDITLEIRDIGDNAGPYTYPWSLTTGIWQNTVSLRRTVHNLGIAIMVNTAGASINLFELNSESFPEGYIFRLENNNVYINGVLKGTIADTPIGHVVTPTSFMALNGYHSETTQIDELGDVTLNGETYYLGEGKGCNIKTSLGNEYKVITNSENGIYHINSEMWGNSGGKGCLNLVAANTDTLTFSDGADDIVGDLLTDDTITNSNSVVFDLSSLSGNTVESGGVTMTVTTTHVDGQLYIDNEIHQPLASQPPMWDKGGFVGVPGEKTWAFKHFDTSQETQPNYFANKIISARWIADDSVFTNRIISFCDYAGVHIKSDGVVSINFANPASTQDGGGVTEELSTPVKPNGEIHDIKAVVSGDGTSVGVYADNVLIDTIVSSNSGWIVRTYYYSSRTSQGFYIGRDINNSIDNCYLLHTILYASVDDDEFFLNEGCGDIIVSSSGMQLDVFSDYAGEDNGHFWGVNPNYSTGTGGNKAKTTNTNTNTNK